MRQMYVGFRQGFIVGALFALLLRYGIVTITIEREITLILLVLGIFIAFHQAFRRKSLINPPSDGFISGFGTILGMFGLFSM